MTVTFYWKQFLGEDSLQNVSILARQNATARDGCQWQEQEAGRVRQSDEAMMLVESHCRLILRIHHQGIGGDLRACSTVERIGQKRSPPQPLPFKCLIDGQE